MPHAVTVDTARHIVVARFEGSAHRAAVMELVQQARDAAKASGLNILYDMRAATLAVSSGELFWMPRQLEALRSPDAGKVRVACVSLPEHVEGARTWETIFRNAGLQARAFTRESEAVAWLTE
jgi:hypothetical protein